MPKAWGWEALNTICSRFKEISLLCLRNIRIILLLQKEAKLQPPKKA